MRILDRYAFRQLIPVWLWCLAIFLFLTCLIDLFGHLDEILRYRIPLNTILEFYLSFLPIVFVRASPVALLISTAFIGSRMARHLELLAINAGGTHPFRASYPFLFLGLIASCSVFFVGDFFLPQSSIINEQIREEAFRVEQDTDTVENVAYIDEANRLYHARSLELTSNTLHDLHILENDEANRPISNLYAQKGTWLNPGWKLTKGSRYRIDAEGRLQANPEPFDTLFIDYPVTPKQFTAPRGNAETMSFSELKQYTTQLRANNAESLKRYELALMSKLSLPFTNLIMALIAFVGATQPSLRGNLKGLGLTLVWGLSYYLFVAVAQSIAEITALPPWAGTWGPHIIVLLWLVYLLENRKG